jgi:EmrB/QacA subfamily drug resistance transporter
MAQQSPSAQRAGSASTGTWVLVATILASSMAFIDGSALNVALDALQKDLHATGADLLWVVNAYLLLLASLILLGGSLGDHFGRNRIFRFGILLFSGASLASGLSPSIGFLIAARAIQGIGGALMVPGSLAIISANFPAEQRGGAIGIWSAAGTITTIGGPLLGGFLANSGFWRGVFFINLPLAAIALIALARVPETRDETATARLDYAGTALVAIGLAGLTYGAIAFGGSATGGPSVGLAALAIGVAALIAFVLVERRVAHPLVDFTLFRSRTFRGANLMTALLYGALGGALLFLPLNLIQVQGYPAAVAGFTFLPFTAALAVISPFTGRLLRRFGPRLLLTAGPIVVAAGFVLMTLPGLTAGPADYFTAYFPAILVIGIGMGITVAPLTTAVMGSAPSSHAGVASGINNAVSRSAQVLATAILGAVALGVFAGHLEGRTAGLPLSEPDRAALRLEAANLANARIPAAVSDEVRDSTQLAIKLAFVDTFRQVVLLAAVAAVLSGVMSWFQIEAQIQPRDDEGTASAAA